ncbi:MerR family transcriptional regulator [Bacillus ndiopicus]|uniref:MerR family transcriptional regulator n=1 Tax=Bacillus ndiopicus TaxID=1347368 RepID=UPI0005A8B07C|nr:MerR family transcriptional regulator [Bacillus ndiopicus]
MLKISELAEMTGITKRTIDYYTNLGLLKAHRSNSNYRYYNEESVKQLQFIEQKKKEGLSLKQIKALTQSEMADMDIANLCMHIQQLEKEVIMFTTRLSNENQLMKQRIMKNMKNDSKSLIQTLQLLIT